MQRGRVLITGGSGFIGTHLCAALIDRGYQPVVLDRIPPRRADVEFHHGDVVELGGPRAALLDNVDALYHLAWTTKPQSASEAPLYDLQTNLVPGLQLLDALVRRSRPPRVVFLSTGGAIYGRTSAERIAEDHPTFPLNAYGVSKLAFEHYLRLYRYLHDLDYLIFRPSNPYGEFQDPRGTQGAVAVFLGRLATGSPITIWGDGSAVRDYLYVGDVADALVRSLEYQPGEHDPRVFNVGSGRGMDLRQLIAIMSRVTGRHTEIVFTAARKADAPRVVLDVARLRERLGWSPTTEIEQGINRTWDWISSQSGVSRAAPVAMARPTPAPPRRMAVYTCITGNYDTLVPPDIIDDKLDYHCFTDDPSVAVRPWKARDIDLPALDAKDQSRYVKMHPHVLLPEYDATVYIDGNIRILGDLYALTSKALEEDPGDILVYDHFIRDCVFAEAAACTHYSHDWIWSIAAQMRAYRREGYPIGNGLYDGSVIIRRDTPDVRRLMEAWWAEYRSGLKRDQVSLPVVAWRLDIPIGSLGENDRFLAQKYFTSSSHRRGGTLVMRLRKYLNRSLAAAISYHRLFSLPAPLTWK